MHLAREDRAVARLVDAAQLLHDRGGDRDLVAGDRAAPAALLERLKFAADGIGVGEIGGVEIGRQHVGLPALAEQPDNALRLLAAVEIGHCPSPPETAGGSCRRDDSGATFGGTRK
jgi:hypothetical protein